MDEALNVEQLISKLNECDKESLVVHSFNLIKNVRVTDIDGCDVVELV